ncbi:MAG: TRAP transporter large permease subunit, partial [Candidatus Competibacteraceae bacterium]|nr:TRAP transporter large permease subunit [Candidatus Competibacteraceae bacterium]
SVGDMYKGAVLPGLILGAMYVGWVLLNTLFRPHLTPALPPEARTLHGWGLFKRVIVAMVPPLLLIFLVLGTIFIGWATPTEGGAMGAVGALLLAFFKGKLNRKMLTESLHSTAKIASFVIFILIGSSVFSLVFRGVDGDLWVEHLLLDLPGGAMGFLIFVNILVFLLAFFLDFFEISFIILPLLAPVAEKLGIDLVWFGILMGVNMQTSFMHPPFGFALFYLRSVAPPTIRTTDIYWGAVPFVVIQVIMVALIIAFPSLVTLGLDRPAPTGQPAPIQLLAPQDHRSGVNRDDAADLFRQLQPAGQ